MAEGLELLHPQHDAVPTGTGLVHHFAVYSVPWPGAASIVRCRNS
jgi:hypothetical protein